MASNLKFSTALRDAMMDAMTTYAAGSCILRIYDGTQATNANTSLGAQVLLAELTCNATFAGASSSGTITLNSITQDSSANASGTATWFRLLKSNGSTVVCDGSVGTSGADLNLNSVAISSGAAVSVTSATFTAGNA